AKNKNLHPKKEECSSPVVSSIESCGGMGIFQHLCVEDHEEGSGPLLAEAGSIESSPAASGRPEPREFFLSPKKNLALSLVLLFASYSALLVPAYLPVQHPIWRGWDLAPPLGLQGSEEMLAHTLSALPLSGLPFSPDRCRRCIVVGSGGILRGKHLGDHIDKYDIIIRMNNAPVFGFEKDAGSRTTIRLMYPEGAPILNQEYHNTDIIALVVFKRLDLEWLLSVVTNEPLSWWSKLWFWKNVVNEIPLPPGNFRITNPEILNRTWHLLLTYNKQQRKTVPTLGLSGVVLALQLCDEVSLAGFGYDLQQPGARLHYYEALRMDTMMSQVVHDVTAESSLLQELVKARVVHDLTGVL
ncbi:hypothetical protein P4O66_013632, partial [Electrophorus voltai]